jgi:phage-related protein (TIGR01555 family)
MNNSFRLDSIANIVTDIGSGNDPTTYGRPTLEGRLSVPELEALYLQNDLAGRIVDEILNDALSPGLPPLKYLGTDEPVKLDFKQIRFLAEKIREAATNARIYGGGHILLIVDDGKSLEQPLDWEAATLPTLLNTITLDRYEATPTHWGEDASKPDFLEVTHYQVQPSNSGAATNLYPVVHASRLISFKGRRLPRKLKRQNTDYDDSVLQAVWHAVRNFYQSEQAIVNIINRFEIATLSIAGLSDVQTEEEGTKLLQERMALLHKTLSILQLAMIDADAGESYERRFATVTGLDTLWDRLGSSVAKAARMPKTQLFGESSSGIRGDDEAGGKSWRKQVQEYRESELLYPVVQLTTMMLGRRVEPFGEWGLAESPKPVDEARILDIRAKAAQTLVDTGVITTDEARNFMVGTPIDWEDPAPPPPEPEPEPISLPAPDLLPGNGRTEGAI